MIDPTRLYTALLNTGLQNKDNALYQVIHDLIGNLAKINTDVTTVTNNISSITQVTQQTIVQMFGSEEGGGDSDSFPIPSPSSNSSDAFIPYYIGPGETFVIPVNKQAVFAMNIDNEGILMVDGFLIEV